MSLMLNPSFCIVGYSPQDHWINKKISRVTSASVTHVSFRISICNEEYETYILTKPTDTFVPVRKIKRVLPPPSVQTPWFCPTQKDWVKDITEIAIDYGHGSVLSSGFYHYIGRHLFFPPPRTCTDLVWRCCQRVGINLKERFYPHRLIKEFYQCML